MPYASVTFPASAGQTVFGPVTFPGGAALQSSHIKAYVNGSLVSATVSGSLSAPTVTLASGAPAGANVRIERQTPTTAALRLVDFEDGDVLTASDLDTAMLNNLYVAQEANDVGSNGLPLDPVNNVWNAGGRKIVGGVNPSASTDFATKGYVDSVAFGPSSGTVTSVGLTMPSIFDVGNSPITTSGNLNVSFPKVDQSKVLAAPSNAAGIPDFRVLAAADIPSLTASKITDFNTAVRTNRLDQMTTPTGSVSMGSQLITSLLTPVNASDAATKGYVDSKGFMDWTPNAITPTIVANTTVQVECRLTNSVNSRLNTINWTSASGAFNGGSGQNWFRINNNTGQTVTLLLMHSTIQWDLAGFNQCANPSPVPFPWSTLDTVNYTNAGGLITLTNGSFHYFKSLNPLGSEWGNSPYNNFAQGVAGTRASWVLWFLRLS
jgi:hypothetical protein